MRRRLADFSLLVAAIVFVEILLRLFDPIGIGHFAEVRKYAKVLTFGETYGYLHTPGRRARVQGVDVVINEHGLRGPSTTVDKPAGTKRLLILGDSVVFGWGAPQDSIFPARLQRGLAAHDPAVEVIAAGVASWNTRTEYEWLRARGLAFGPDVLLLVVVGNDADPIHVGRTDVPTDSLLGPDTPARPLRALWQAGYQRSRILAYVQYARVFVRQRSIESAPPDFAPWRDARSALDGVIELCTVRGIELVVFLYGDEERVAKSGVLRAYRDHLAARGMSIHTFPRVIFEDRRYHNSLVDGHENALGHARLEEAIAPVIVPLMTSAD